MNNTVSAGRIRSIDILRGIVMVVMALDHTRDYFSNYYGNPTDLTTAGTGMFLTRWITHFCAPVFVFLAGTSAFLSLQKKKSRKEASLFLVTRGIWLIILEVTVVRFGWQFNIDYSLVFVQVIWAIGWSMLFLAALIHLPYYLVLSIGLIFIFGHNMLDSIHAADTDNRLLWHFIHEQGFVTYHNVGIFIIYPLIPWIGVMATGYCFGRLFQFEQGKRNRWLYVIGISATALFIMLRAYNVYGDPLPWSVQDSFSRTVLSFINCQKYPPSLLYLLMTLGPSILVMPLLEQAGKRTGSLFTVYGRVPLFYYILHLYLLHSIAIAAGIALGVPYHYFVDNDTLFAPKPGWGFPLPVVYLVWLVAVAILYFPCRWFMKVKQEQRRWWLSYL